MLKRLFKIMTILFLSIVFIGSVAMAQDKDNSQNEDRPPGWDKGKKEGWRSDVPPGQEEKEEKKKKEKKEKKGKKAKKSKK